jgi:hypothetical protein
MPPFKTRGTYRLDDEDTLFEITEHEGIWKGLFDGSIPFAFSYTDNTVTLHSEYGTDVVGKLLYTLLRPHIQYEGAEIFGDEECRVGESGPSGTDAYFLPVFAGTTIPIPLFFKEICESKVNLVLPTRLALNP